MSTPPYACILVEDNSIDSLMAQAMIRRYPALLRLDAVCDNAADALLFLNEHTVDVLFSDVEMEGLSGLQLRERAMHLPACVFITAFPEFAVNSYDLAALDYIMKPLTAARFAIAVKRVDDYMELRRKASLLEHTVGEGGIFLKEGTAEVKVDIHQVLYLEALRDYTRIVTTSAQHSIHSTLQQMLEKPAFGSFVRIHRSFAVQKHFVQRKDSRYVHLPNGLTLPVGRSYKDVVATLG